MSQNKNIFRPRSALTVIAALFAASASLRVATHATTVFAAEGVPVEQKADVNQAAPQGAIPTKDSMQRLLKDLQEREALVREQELEILERLKYLEATETKINQKMQQLEAAENTLRSTLALANSAAENDLAKLTAVYESMKPKTAAALFDEMDPNFAAGFIGRMKPEAAAAILAGMKPQAAYNLSTIIAARNTNAPTD